MVCNAREFLKVAEKEASFSNFLKARDPLDRRKAVETLAKYIDKCAAEY